VGSRDVLGGSPLLLATGRQHSGGSVGGGAVLSPSPLSHGDGGDGDIR